MCCKKKYSWSGLSYFYFLSPNDDTEMKNLKILPVIYGSMIIMMTYNGSDGDDDNDNETLVKL